MHNMRVPICGPIEVMRLSDNGKTASIFRRSAPSKIIFHLHLTTRQLTGIILLSSHTKLDPSRPAVGRKGQINDYS